MSESRVKWDLLMACKCLHDSIKSGQIEVSVIIQVTAFSLQSDFPASETPSCSSSRDSYSLLTALNVCVSGSCGSSPSLPSASTFRPVFSDFGPPSMGFVQVRDDLGTSSRRYPRCHENQASDCSFLSCSCWVQNIETCKYSRPYREHLKVLLNDIFCYIALRISFFFHA